MLHFLIPPEEVDTIREVIMKRMLRNYVVKRVNH
jgi:hypothetical protein